jgi:hypothetical protein
MRWSLRPRAAFAAMALSASLAFAARVRAQGASAAAPSASAAPAPPPWSPTFTPPVYPAYPGPLVAPTYAAAPAIAPTYGAGPPAYPSYPPAAPSPEPPARDPRVADAHADRVIVTPTAYTHPEGTVYATSYDIVGLQAGWAFSDSAQVTVTGMPPLQTEQVVPLDLTVKAAVFRAPRVRAAVLGSVSGLLGTDQGPVFVGRAGGVVQACFDDGCDASASIGSTLLLAGPALLSVEGAGAIVPLSRLFAILVEADTLVPLGKVGDNYNGVAAGAGVRFRGRSWAVDLAAARPLDRRDAPVVPLLAVSYRLLP